MLAAAAAKREAALKIELQALKLGQLCTRATNEGVDALALEQAQDSDTPKEAVITLLLKQAVVSAAPAPATVATPATSGGAEGPSVGAADGSPASSSPASSVTEPAAAASSSAAAAGEEEGKASTAPGGGQHRSSSKGGGGRAGGGRRTTVQLSCPQCSEEFKAHAPVKQKRTRKCRCGGCGEALTAGFCPGCGELTAWTAAARTHQNASCASCFAAFHVAKCPGCKEVAAYVGTHAAAQISSSSSSSSAASGANLSPHTSSKLPGSATAAAQSSGLTCENCSLHFFECGCPACGASHHCATCRVAELFLVHLKTHTGNESTAGLPSP